VYPFKVSEASMNKWTDELHKIIDQANYHYTSRDYTLPYKFAAEEVLL
jgi:hypothetical protein